MRHSKRSRGFRLSDLILAVMMLVFISAKTARAASSDEILILTGTDPNFLPVTLASEKGFFKSEGINVAQRLFPSGADAMLAFRGIGAQFVAAGDIPSILLWSEFKDSVGVASIFASTENLFGVVSSSIHSPADLKGKKIATKKSSTAEYFVHTYLKKNDIIPGEVNIIDLSPPEMVPAMVAGQIDGFFIWRPYPSQAEKILGDQVRVLTSAKGYYVERILLNANRSYAEAHPQDVEKVLLALQKAIEYAYANPDDAAKIVARKIKTDPAIVRQVIDLRPFRLEYGPAVSNELGDLSGFLVERGRLKTRLPLSKDFDERYLRDIGAKPSP